MRGQADDIVFVNWEYNEKCMLERNRYMVDHASVALAVYSGTARSGTSATVRYAKKLGQEILVIEHASRKSTGAFQHFPCGLSDQ